MSSRCSLRELIANVQKDAREATKYAREIMLENDSAAALEHPEGNNNVGRSIP